MNNVSRPGPAQQVVMYNSIHDELIDHIILHGTSHDYSGYLSAIHVLVYENISAYNPIDNAFNESANGLS
jgi:hypothetical protein